MKRRRLLITALSLGLLSSCKGGGRDRFGESSPLPPESANLYDARADASSGGARGSGGNSSEPPPDTTDTTDAIRDAAAPRDEIDNTLYWDAATRPTSDHVRDVDAGEPQR